MPDDNGRKRRKSKAEKREGYLLTVLKNTWYTFALIVFLFAGSVIFMGIEGNHQEFEQYKRLEEQIQYNISLKTWLEGNLSAAVAIRKDIGLDESLPVERYSAILEEQMNKNFTASKLHFTANCSYAKYILTSWNAKLNGDAFMYAVSVISTVGWGVYSPPDTTLRIVTLVYLAFGIPIFAVLISDIMNFLNWIEGHWKRSNFVQRYLGDKDLIAIIQILFVFIVMLLYGVMCDILVERERESVLEKALIATGTPTEWSFLVSLYYTVITFTTIGFGDMYVHSPGHAVLNIAPVISAFASAFSIALFAKLMSRLQTNVEKSGTKRVLRARQSVAAIQLGVIRMNNYSVERDVRSIKEDIMKEIEEEEREAHDNANDEDAF